MFTPNMNMALLTLLALTTTPHVLGALSTREVAASRLLVTLKEGATPNSLINKVPVLAQWSIIPGFAVNKADVDIDQLLADPSVEAVEEDSVVQVSSVKKTDAPWGLGRLNVRKAKTLGTAANPDGLNFDFEYKNAAGAGVDIYVVDSGMNINHQDFGGRASWGIAVGGLSQADGNGHGTHVASITAGTQFGVAKGANIIAVRISDDSGSGTLSDLHLSIHLLFLKLLVAHLIFSSTTGMDWIYNQVTTSPFKGRVVNLALSGAPHPTVDAAVKKLIDQGVHVVVAAGNFNMDAINFSPARVPEAITVGATNITDHKWVASNWGDAVDLYAPGENIIGASHANNDGTRTDSGTSMAAAHVSGLVAYLLSTEGSKRSPKSMKELLLDGWGSYSVRQGDRETIHHGDPLIAQINECDFYCWVLYS